jgi:hypothetical protein
MFSGIGIIGAAGVKFLTTEAAIIRDLSGSL